MYHPVSIIIPSYKKKKLLKKTLQSILGQVNYSSYDDEVLVIDDGIYDANIIEQFNVWHLMCLHHPYQLASNCNFGLQMASNPIIVKIDADCVPQHNWLRATRQSIRPNQLVVGRVEWQRPNKDNRPDTRFDYQSGVYNNDTKTAPQQAWGGNLAAYKEDLLSLGGWTEAYDGNWGSEESDLGWKWYYHGKDIKFVFESLVEHQYHEDSQYRSMEGQKENYQILKERKKQYKENCCSTGQILL